MRRLHQPHGLRTQASNTAARQATAEHCVQGGSSTPHGGFCPGSLVASAGEANLTGLVVSSRTKQNHSSSDAALHHQTGLVPFTETTRRLHAGTTTQPTNTPPASSRTPHSRSEAARRVGAAGGPALDFRRPPNAAGGRQTKRMRSDSDSCAVVSRPAAGRQRNLRRSTELRHQRSHQTVREAVRKRL